MTGGQSYSSFFPPFLYAISNVQKVYTHIVLTNYSSNTKASSSLTTACLQGLRQLVGNKVVAWPSYMGVQMASQNCSPASGNER